MAQFQKHENSKSHSSRTFGAADGIDGWLKNEKGNKRKEVQTKWILPFAGTGRVSKSGAKTIGHGESNLPAYADRQFIIVVSKLRVTRSYHYLWIPLSLD